MGNITFFVKWAFVFTVLALWSSFVISGSMSNELFIPTNVPIYMQTDAGIEHASSADVREILFNKNFEIEKRYDLISAQDCSIRGNGGTVIVNQSQIFGNGDFSFWFSNANERLGSGNFVVGSGNKRFVLDFVFTEVLAINDEELMLRGVGEGRLGRETKVNFDSILLLFNKTSQKVSLVSNGGDFFVVNTVDVSFMEGCLVEGETFYLFKNLEERGEERSIEEVRGILDQNPALIEMFEGLKRLYKEYWWVVFPGGMSMVS